MEGYRERERGEEIDGWVGGGAAQMACVGAGELVMRMACWYRRYRAQQLDMVSLPD